MLAQWMEDNTLLKRGLIEVGSTTKSGPMADMVVPTLSIPSHSPPRGFRVTANGTSKPLKQLLW
jgi:hypothetical protein